MEILGSSEACETFERLPEAKPPLHVVMDLGGLREEKDLPQQFLQVQERGDGKVLA